MNAGPQTFDFCAIQRFVNAAGSVAGIPANDLPPEMVGDRLTQYGFQYWSDLIPHLPRAWDSDEMLPHRPGVYSISVVALTFKTGYSSPLGAQHLLYIGWSQNIAKRLASPDHWHEIIQERFSAVDTAVLVHVLLTKDHEWAERSLIRTLRPLLNVQHNR